MSRKKPTFLKVYAIPVFLLNIVLGGWGVLAANLAHGLPSYLGSAVIVTVGLYLYLMYLDRYFY